MSRYEEEWLRDRLAANPDLRRVNPGLCLEDAPETLRRCKARMPLRFPPDEPQPAVPGGQCGLPEGHSMAHTLLIPTGMPWLTGGAPRRVGAATMPQEGVRQRIPSRTDASTMPRDATAQPPPGSHQWAPVSLVLPYPPTSNTLYATGRDGRRHLSARGRRFTAQVKALVHDWWAQQDPLPLYCPCVGPLCVTLTVHPPDRRRRDIQNLDKIVCDALQKAGMYQDDSQISALHIYRGGVLDVACVEVMISSIRERVP